MVERLSDKCLRDHDHLHLQSKNLAEAAVYPKGLILAILRGIRDTYDANHKWPVEDVDVWKHTVADVQPANSLPAQTQTLLKGQDVASDVSSMTIPFKYENGTKVQIQLQDPFKPRYLDAYTGKELPAPHIHRAIQG